MHPKNQCVLTGEFAVRAGPEPAGGPADQVDDHRVRRIAGADRRDGDETEPLSTPPGPRLPPISCVA